jgi:hypothetical protein
LSGLDLSPLLARLHAFEVEAHKVLGLHEAARSRVVILEETYTQLTGRSLQQDDLFKQALRCVEHELFRAAHVMAFAGFMDFLFEKLSADGLVAVRRERTAWKGKDIYEMAEYVPDKQFIDVAQPVGLATKNDVKHMGSLLDRRNECAHPTAYYPDLNITIGYVAEVLQVVRKLQPRKIT